VWRVDEHVASETSATTRDAHRVMLVLFLATLAAGFEWDTSCAHSAAYDAERTADLFCIVCNQFQNVFDASRRRLASNTFWN